MYVKFLQSTHCIKKTLTVSCTLLCESGDRVKFDQSSFSAYQHAVMLRHHCLEYGFMQRIGKKRTQLQFQHTNYVCLMLTGQNMCIQPSMTLKYGSEVYRNCMFSL